MSADAEDFEVCRKCGGALILAGLVWVLSCKRERIKVPNLYAMWQNNQ